MAGADDEQRRSRDGMGEELAFALCHEIGNLIGAIRLHAHLIDDEMTTRDLAMVSVELDDLSARASALLAHLRPLLSEKPRVSSELSPAALLSRLQQMMDEQGGRGAAVHFRADADLPLLRVEQQVLSFLLQSLLFAALESVSVPGSVSLRAERRSEGVAFVVEDDGEVVEDPTLWREQMKRGRTLLCAVADHILRKHGGRLEVARSGGRTQIGLVLPVP